MRYKSPPTKAFYRLTQTQWRNRPVHSLQHRRIESLFELVNSRAKNLAITILNWNLRDTVNSYEMQEDGNYWKVESDEPFDIHQEFYHLKEEDLVDLVSFENYTLNLETKE